MLDIKFIRENRELVQDAMKSRGLELDIASLLQTDERRREALQRVEELRARQNALSEEVAKAAPAEREGKIAQGKELKAALEEEEGKFRELEGHLRSLLLQLPNIPQEDVPAGDESANVVLRQEGAKPEFGFEPKDHLELGEALGLIDAERAAKVSGSRFAYLKGDLVLLEFALVKLAMEEARNEGFTPVVPPVLIRAEMMQSMGYVDTQEDLEERYFLERDDMFLVGTAEQSIGPMHGNEILEASELPKRYAAFSTCFREEAGSYGKDTRGILRQHQFDKVEFFSFTHPAQSKEEHAFLIRLQERLWKQLKIPYQVVQLSTGDMARPSASTVDIEAWMPGQGRYREVSSASNTTDFQARRLNIRTRGKDGKTEFVHMLNATGFPIGRTLVAIMENYQQQDGSIEIPEVLRDSAGKNTIKPG